MAALAATESMSRSLDAIASTIKDEKEREQWRKTEGDGFQKLFRQFLRTRHETVNWDAIKPPDESMIIRHDSLAEVTSDARRDLASKLVVLKLNGGLGTSMGCVGPKSAIEVKEQQTFLDLVLRQINHLNRTSGVDVPLVLMNSFNTHKDTLKIIEKYKSSNVKILTFNQSRYPRLFQETLQPATTHIDADPSAWYPPGHGDIFPAMISSGVLDELIAMGKEYVFVSNIDNLAATVDFKILQHVAKEGVDFCMEVTDKTRADIKGGTLIKYFGKTKLLEIAQVPKQHVGDFKSVKKFKIFNTNNLWISLKAIKKVVESGALAGIDIIQNPKVEKGVRVLQLETACGAAIQFFSKPLGINVPRDRFLPVKSTADLFVVQSDMYSLKHGTLVMNPDRPFPSVPIIKLGPHFKNMANYNERIQGKINILELDHLTVSGDVYLGHNVTLKGTVIIVASEGHVIYLPNGSVIEDKVVTGFLNILDH